MYSITLDEAGHKNYLEFLIVIFRDNYIYFLIRKKMFLLYKEFLLFVNHLENNAILVIYKIIFKIILHLL